MNAQVRIERYADQGRCVGHIDGHVFSLGERECSVQRRNQKLIEESPARTHYGIGRHL